VKVVSKTGVPTDNIILKSLAKMNENAKVKKIEILGSSEKLSWEQSPDSLVIIKPKNFPNDIAIVFKLYME
jgi:alpha-L-fucosidase